MQTEILFYLTMEQVVRSELQPYLLNCKILIM